MPRSRFTLLLVVTAVACDSRSLAPRDLLVDGSPAVNVAATLNPVEQLGNSIFSDTRLSLRGNQSCASCHDSDFGFSSPTSQINGAGSVMEGSVPGRFGNRRPPGAAYATQAPVRYYDASDGVWVGGNFWDGRASGSRLGNPSAEQALGPFVNPLEQALPDAACVLYRIRTGNYAAQWRAVFGTTLDQVVFPAQTDALCQTEGTTVPLSAGDRQVVTAQYDNVGHAIAAFEASPAVNQFSSKYDAVLDGAASFSAEEAKGFALFNGKAQCALCHPSDGKQALFTDYTYDNIGVPPNPQNPALMANPSFRDLGLGGAIGDATFNGAQKVPSLRNTDKRQGLKGFMHNGAFKRLEDVVHFYNTRDVLPVCTAGFRGQIGVTCWPAPEVAENVNVDELGNLGLTPSEEKAVAAFIRTLNDGFYRRHR